MQRPPAAEVPAGVIRLVHLPLGATGSVVVITSSIVSRLNKLAAFVSCPVHRCVSSAGNRAWSSPADRRRSRSKTRSVKRFTCGRFRPVARSAGWPSRASHFLVLLPRGEKVAQSAG